MNPLDAVSLAATVVQFTDFGVRLLSETAKVYKSVAGMTSDTVELKTIEDDLRQLSQSIQEKSAQLADPIKPPRESEQKLLRLCRTCQTLSTELATVVGRLRTHGTGRVNLAVESFEVAVRKFKSHDKIKDLRSRVSEVRQEMMLTMTVFLWEESKSGADDLDQLSRRQVDMINTLTRIDETTRNFNQTLIMFLQGSIPMDLRQREIIETFWSPKQPIQNISGEDAKSQTDDSMPHNDAVCARTFLNSLFLEDLSYREGAIPKAYKSTFQWLFKSPRRDIDGHPLWPDFRTWLRSSNNDIYWITGKPGSGKSTLMKFITGRYRLQQLLAQWSGSKPFIVATFYFWNAGTPIQRTQEGLLRTLLYQCLTQRPQLISNVCPRRWALFKLFGPEANATAPPWTLEELLGSFSAFDLFAGKQFNLALFIDGLDEFDGDHKSLLAFVRLFHSKAGRKVCVSSRPWNVFQDAFMTSPSLRLENLTEDDIRLYVQSNLSSNPGFREYKGALPEQSDDLVETIITKAQGVFLWVSVVVLYILEGLSEGDRWEELYDIINLLPDDLSQLYQRIWSTIKPGYIGQSSRLFQIHRASVGSLGVITLWLADHPDAFQIDAKTIFEQKDLIFQAMRRRLSSRTRGLLEVSPRGHIGFLHKSVRDWINPIWADIVAKSDPIFDPHLCLVKAQTVCLLGSIMDNGHILRTSAQRYDWLQVLDCFYHAANVHVSASNIPILVATLDRLNDKIEKFSHTPSKRNIVPLLYDETVLQSQITSDRPFPPNSLIGLAAQFGILEYVRHKVTVHPQLLRHRHRPPEASILANAILSPRYFDTTIEDGVSPDIYQYYRLHNDSYVRFLLVKFLLGRGVAKSSAVIPGNVTRSLCDEARSRRVQMPPIVMPSGEEMDYWQTVAKLLKKHGRSKVGYFELEFKPRLLKLFHRLVPAMLSQLLQQ
ncbi:hypothetical protein F4680DRAFT_435889 [Xylaria scruposa]|nr:hypothetical protein F4680DRAFT_435889 [Xylaria scruposa]